MKGMLSWRQTLGYTLQRQLLYTSKSIMYHSQSYIVTAAACTLLIAAYDRASSVFLVLWTVLHLRGS